MPSLAASRLIGAAFLLLVCSISPSAVADVQTRPMAAKPALTLPDQVPAGLTEPDWQGIRAAYESGRHGFQAVDGGWKAYNPGQEWVTSFDHRGFTARPQHGEWTWGLELIDYGFAQTRAVVSGIPAVKVDGQRLSYQWDEIVEEWFVNDQRGLEHGFILAKRPAGPLGEPLSFTLSVRGGLSPRITSDARGVDFLNDDQKTVLNYSGLKVWDADGTILNSRFEAEKDGNFRLLVDEKNARYPITIDPVAQQAYLKASNTGPGHSFGRAVAISGDTVVVGALNEGGNSGAVYVFTRSGSTWTQQAYLKADNADGADYFGHAVAISGDTLVVGAFGESSNATGVNANGTNNSAYQSGAAYVFTRSGGVWTQQAYLKASNTGAGDLFGSSVAISGDTVVVGAFFEDSNGSGINGDGANNNAPDAGAAYVFVRNGGTWSQEAFLKASNTGLNTRFGNAVAVSGDTLVVGSNREFSSATGVNPVPSGYAADAGAAYVFTRSAGVWSQQAYLKASNSGAQDFFGSAVAVDADTVIVGANNEASNSTGVNGNQTDNSLTGAGAAYVFTRTGQTWSQQAYLKEDNTAADRYFGISAAVSGNTAVIGSYGGPKVFTRSGGMWAQHANFTGDNTEPDERFGYAVSISGDTVLVGADLEDSNATGVNGDGSNNSAMDSGAAYAFLVTPMTVPTISAPTVTAVNTISATLGGEVTGDGGGIIFERGIVYSITSANADPLISGSGVTKVSTSGGTGVFTMPVTGFAPNTAYTFKAYASNGAGTVYTNVGTFTTTANSTPTDIFPTTTGRRINWITLEFFNDQPAQVNTYGTHHAAVRFGASDLVVNGVTFSRYLGNGSFANGSLISTSDATQASLGSSGTGTYGALVSSGGYRNSAGTITISGLTTGQLYQVQLFMPYWDSARFTSFKSPGGTALLLRTGNNPHPFPAYSGYGFFLATGPTHEIEWAPESNPFALLAAVSVRQVPNAAALSIAENNAAGATVSMLAALDANQEQIPSFSLVSGPGDQDNASFTITGDLLKITASADFETKSSYSIRVQANDGAGGTFSKALTVNITDLLEPTVTASTSAIPFTTSSITITGTNFSTTPGENTVNFIPTGTGTVTASTSTSLTVSGLTGLSYGALHAVVVMNGQTSGAPVQVATVVNSVPTDIVRETASPTVVWGAATSFNNSPSQVSTLGAHHAAARFGTVDLEVNGVTFSGYTGGGSFANGSSAITTTSSTVGSTATGGSGNYGALVSSGGYQNFAIPGNITIGGLTPGKLYQVQLFMPFWDSLRPTLFISSGGPTLVLQCGAVGNPNPDIRTGLFRASSTTHEITWDNQAPNAFALLAAVSVRQINDNFEIAENNAPGATVGSLATVDADPSQTHTFSLVSGSGDADNASFVIDGNILKITPVADFETKSSYSIRVRVSDGAGGTFEKVFTIGILDVAGEAPSVLANTISVPQNQVTLTIQGANFSPIAAQNTVSFSPSGSGTVTASTATSLTVTGISGLTTGALSAVVTTNSLGSGAPVQVATVSSNSAPTGIASVLGNGVIWDAVRKFDNNATQVSTAGSHHAAVRFAASDLAVNGVTFSGHTGGGSFANGSLISSTTPTINSLGSGGTGAYGSLVSSGGFVSGSGNLTISGLTAGRIYQVQLFMPFWDTLRPTIFGSSGGSNVTLRCGFTGNPNPDIRTGVFRATSSSQTISWAPESPNTFALLAAASVRLLETDFRIAENNIPGATVGTLAAVDADAGQSHTFTLVSGSGGVDNGSFTIIGNALRITPVADFETRSSYSIRVRAHDGVDGSFETVMNIGVIDLENEPSVIANTANIGLGQTSLTITGINFSTTPSLNTVTFSPSGSGTVTSSTATSLTVTGISGLSVGPLGVVVVASGQSTGAPVQVATVVNATPTDIAAITASTTVVWDAVTKFNNTPSQVSTAGTYHAAVRFGGSDLVVNGVTFSRHTGSGAFANGSLVSTSSATHNSVRTGGSGSYGSLVSSGGFRSGAGSIVISGLTVGQLYQVQLFMPFWDLLWPTRFASTNGSSVTLQCGFTGNPNPDIRTGLFRAMATTHSIAWSPEPASTFALLAAVSVRLLDGDFKIAENNAPGATVGTLNTSDPDPVQTHTYSLVAGDGDGDNASFSIVGNSLNLNLAADYETKSSYAIRVQVDDGAGGVFSKALTVAIIDVEETTAIENWRFIYFGNTANSGNGANAFDFDKDGLSNLVEYAFGLNPTLGASVQLPQAQMVGGQFVASFTGVDGVTYSAEWSSTLQAGSWTSIPDSGSGNTHSFSVPVGTHPRLFMRYGVRLDTP